MDIETIKDIKTFYKCIGALDELSERDLLRENDNGEKHEIYLKKILDKYGMEYNNKKVTTLIEQADYNMDLEMIIDKEFTNLMRDD